MNLKALEPKGQEHCSTLALVILVLLQCYNGHLVHLKVKQKSYDDVWRKFRKVHEEHVECLEVLNYMEELERVRTSYQSKWRGN